MAEHPQRTRTPHPIRLKRVYAAAEPEDGLRILVERLWPRVLRKDAARIDLWLKDIAPSHELRRWFHAAPEDRWPEFAERYRAELRNLPDPMARLREYVGQGPASLLFAAHDEAHNSAVVLRAVLEGEKQ